MLPIDGKTIRFLSRMGARGVLGQAVYDCANDGMDFCVLSADLARASGFDRFSKEYPDRIINAGIAEANMVGMASGLASSRTPVIATTWATFASARVADQVRNYMGFMKSNVKLIGMDSGYENNRFGYTHTNGPDISILGGIPNITIIAPSDGIEIYQAIKATLEIQGPVYIRLTGGQTLPLIHKDSEYAFSIIESEIIREGRDVLFISNGVILSNVMKVADRLADEGYSCGVVNLHTINPTDMEFIDDYMDCQLIVTVEEHPAHGGIGSIVAQNLAARESHPRLEMICSKDTFTPAGSYGFALKYNGLDEENMYERVRKNLSDRKPVRGGDEVTLISFVSASCLRRWAA